MGRRPEPESVQNQKAAVRSRRVKLDSADQQISPLSIEPPPWLKKEGRRIWYRLAPNLRTARLLTELDALVFARYCRNFARWLSAQKSIDKEGETYESESQWGKLKRINPALLVSDRLERQLLAAEDRFGLNPAERQRIYAARAASSGAADLFTPQGPDRREDDPAAKPAAPAEPIDGPVGLLN